MGPCREPRTVTAEATAATADPARAWLVMGYDSLWNRKA